MELSEKVLRLELGQEKLREDFMELQKMHAQGMHDLGQARQEIKNMSVQINQLLVILKGVEDDPLSPGLVHRFKAAEEFIEWIKNKKTLAIGVAIAIGAVGTFVWFLGDLVIRAAEIKRALGR